MNRKTLVSSILFFFVLGALTLLAPTSTLLGADDVTTASVNGKYQTLLMTVYAPQDQASYGSYYDWGYSTTTSWGGYSNLPSGYWVYVYPNWYIWKSISAGGGANLTKASVSGKYYNLLRVINVPQDRGSYGDFDDYGYYSSTSYAGYDYVPAGYWVYLYPDWYIWGNQR